MPEIRSPPSNMSEICRLCLSSEDDFLSIFDDEGTEESPVPLTFRILACVSVEVSPNDGLSSLICHQCLNQVNSWHDFKQVCDSSQNTLKEWLITTQKQDQSQDSTHKEVDIEAGPESEKHQEIVIKLEPIDILDDDEVFVENNTRELMNDIKQEDHVNETSPQSGNAETRAEAATHDDPLGLTVIETQGNFLPHQLKVEPVEACEEDFDGNTTIHVTQPDHSKEIDNSNEKNSLEGQNMIRVKEEFGGLNFSSSEQVDADNQSVKAGLRTRSLAHKMSFFMDMEDKPYSCTTCSKSFSTKALLKRHELIHIPTTEKDLNMCTLCGKTFSNRSNLERHVRLHTGLKAHSCARCFHQFPNKSMYMKHRLGSDGSSCFPRNTAPPPGSLESSPVPSPASLSTSLTSSADPTYDGDDVFYCYVCKQNFPSKQHLKIHMNSHSKYSCYKCKKTFSGGTALSNHLRSHNILGFKRHTCRICMRTFSSAPALVAHKKSHFRIDVLTKSAEAAPPSSKPEVEEQPPEDFKKEDREEADDADSSSQYSERGTHCRVCNKWVKSNNALERHVSTHNRVKMYSCSICQLSMGYAYSVSKHMKVRHGIDMHVRDVKPFLHVVDDAGNKTPFEESELASATDQEVHKENEKSSDPSGELFSCHICNKKFIQEESLENHMKLIHDGKPTYKCNICSKEFPYKSILLRHTKIHFGKSLFKCSVCFKQFTNLRTLNHHKGIHTRYQCYTCNICYMKLNGLNSLREHQKTHFRQNNSLVCQHCGKQFTSESEFQEHKQLHIKLKIYTCTVCKNFYNSSSALSKHKKRYGHYGGSILNLNPFANVNLLANKSGSFQCDICKKSFSDGSLLARHKMLHINRALSKERLKRPNMIAAASTPSRTSTPLASSTMRSASSTPVNSSKEDALICKPCNRPFTDRLSLIRHKAWHTRRGGDMPTDQTPERSSSSIYNCDYCQKSYTNLGTLNKHKRLHCPEMYQSTTVGESPVIKQEPEEITAEADPSDLIGDEVEITPLPPPKPPQPPKPRFPCKLCRKVFPTQKALMVHKGWHSRSPKKPNSKVLSNPQPVVENEDIDMDFEREEYYMQQEDLQKNVSYKESSESEDEMKYYKCKVCKKTFTNTSSLKRHQQLHARSRGSPRSFMLESDHSMAIPEEEHEYSCNICFKTFKKLTYLRDHIRIHTGEKPFACDKCPRSFSRKSVLWKHQKMHRMQGLYSCSLCDEKFQHEAQLNQHLALHNDGHNF